jgi:hypothetical protein
MKKITFMALLIAALVLGLVSCENGLMGGGGSLLSGHYNVYDRTGSKIRDTMYFEGDQYWVLNNDKMVDGGKFTYDDTYIEWDPGVAPHYGKQKYDKVDKDTVFLHWQGAVGNISLGDCTLKRSGRKGHMVTNIPYSAPTFVDD